MRVLITVWAAMVIGVGWPACAGVWEISLDANLTLTQNAYSDNWTGGEVGIVAGCVPGYQIVVNAG